MASHLPLCDYNQIVKILLLIAAVFAMSESLIATNASGATIYVSTRTDGLPGNGTAANPYNGSTEAQFDALMKAIPPNTTIELSAGTFLSDGSDVLSVKSGWTINGAGMGKTILKLAGHVSANNAKHCNLRGSGITNVQISNLTCDGNATGWNWIAHQAIGGIFFNKSTNVLIDHVEVINCYGDRVQGLEQFSILICGTPQLLAVNCVIQNCETHEYAPGATYTNGPMISYATNPLISNCTDDGSNHGFGFTDTNGAKITGCTSTSNTAASFYTDTGANSDLTIESNTFTAALIPIQFNSASSEDHVKILDNALKSYNSTGSGEAAIVLCGQGGGIDFQIDGNTHAYLGTNHSGLILDNGKNFTELDVEDNSSNAGLVGGGGNKTDVTDVATNVSGNNFNESLAALAENNTAGAPATQNTTADSTTSSNTSNSTTSTASNTAKTASSTTASTASNTAKSAANSSTPKQALASIAKMPAGPARTSLIQSTFFQWTHQSPSDAARYAQSMPPGADRSAAMDTVATQWASSDAAAATDWATSLPPDTDETQHIFHKVAETWAEQATGSSTSDRPTAL
jgi:hypothetical protein